jgi:hypothetical protein
MKTTIIIFLLLFSTIINAQISFSPKLGTSFDGNVGLFAGAELQGSNVAVSAEWRAFNTPKKIILDGFCISGTYYCVAYRSSPFFLIGIITYGHNNISEVTNKPVRSMPILVGYRWYPVQTWNYLADNLSFKAGGGVELCEHSTKLCIEISGAWTLFKTKQ